MKSIYNKKERVASSVKTPLAEFESIVDQVKNSENNARSVVVLQDHYISYYTTERMLKDLERFCVKGNAVFTVDTTFELADGFWLTDSTYENKSLINKKGEHPLYPGPYMWHFRKTQQAYRYGKSSFFFL